MADYDWGCQGCGRFPGHFDWCKHSPGYKTYLFEQKMKLGYRHMETLGYVWSENAQAYRCHRGCGALVWNVQHHDENVCTR